MDEQIKKQWVEALRSGKYKQGREYLRTELSKGTYNYCCLGVLCDIKDERIWDHKQPQDYINYAYSEFPSYTILDWAKLNGKIAEGLAAMNDCGASFEEIADWIETNL